MNPFLSNELAGEHIRDLREQAARARRRPGEEEPEESDRGDGLTIRLFAERDIDEIRRLAALDSKPIPVSGVLVAELAGELVAALPLDGGEALADPFKRTADIVDLLRLRASQLREASEARTSRRHLPGRTAAAHKLA